MSAELRVGSMEWLEDIAQKLQTERESDSPNTKAVNDLLALLVANQREIVSNYNRSRRLLSNFALSIVNCLASSSSSPEAMLVAMMTRVYE